MRPTHQPDRSRLQQPRTRAARARRGPAARRWRRRRTSRSLRGAGRPGDARAGLRAGELGEIEEGVEGGVAAADHQHPPAGVAGAVGARGRPGCRRRCDPHGGFALGGRSRPRRAGSGDAYVPEASMTARARRVSSPAVRRDAEDERRFLASGVLMLVVARRADAHHASVEPQMRPDRGQRGRAARDSRSTSSRPVGMPIAIGLVPAGLVQQLARGRVDVVAPGREDPDVAPLADAAPTWAPASRMMGASPRLTSWAAAASPTGPAPMTATGSVSTFMGLSPPSWFVVLRQMFRSGPVQGWATARPRPRSDRRPDRPGRATRRRAPRGAGPP